MNTFEIGFSSQAVKQSSSQAVHQSLLVQCSGAGWVGESENIRLILSPDQLVKLGLAEIGNNSGPSQL